MRWIFAFALLLTMAYGTDFAIADDLAPAPAIVDDEPTPEEEESDDEDESEEGEGKEEGEGESNDDDEAEDEAADKEDEEEESADETKESDGSSGDEKEAAPAAKDAEEDAKPAEDKAAADDEKADDDEKAADDEKADDEKPADAKPAAEETKAAAEKKPAEEKKKPDTHKVEAKKLTIEVEAEGVFVAKEAEEVDLRPEVWASFKVREAVPHGKRVRKGEVLVKFDDKEIEEALTDKSIEQRVGELTFMAAEEEFPRLEKSIDLNYEQAERSHKQAADEYERFQSTMREMSEKMAKYYLSSAEQDLDNAREELTQLEKMYQADELTEETEEIVLKRQKFQVKAAEFFMEYSKINHDYTMDVSIPEREKSLSTAVELAKIEFERAKMAKSLGVNKERYQLQALREGRGRSVESHAKLVADRALMTLKAPTDGIAYYGRCVNGRWAEVSSMEQKLIPFGNVAPNSVVMTIVSDRPMYIETSVGEKEMPTVKVGQPVTLTLAADEEVELTGKVDKLADVPGGGNKFAVKVELGSDDAPEWLMPGMIAKAKIKTYEAEEAVVVPADLVQSDEDEPKKKYVMLQVEDEEKPVRRDIKLGKKKDKEVEVAKGLKAGDQIVKGAKDEKEEKDEKDEEKSDEKSEEKSADKE